MWTLCARGRTRGDSPPAGGPWEAWGSLMDLCGRFRPVGPPRSSCDACVGRVCHCHCGSECSSRHPVRLVWVNGSFGCRTIAARARDLILDTILAVTNSYSTILVLPWMDVGNLAQDQPEVCGTTTPPKGMVLRYPPPSGDGPAIPPPPPPPLRGWSWVPAAMSGLIERPPRVCSKEGGEAVPRTP